MNWLEVFFQKTDKFIKFTFIRAILYMPTSISRGTFYILFAGLLWSFGPVVVRNMDQAHHYVFQYLFCRGLSVATILICFLIYREGFGFYKNFLRIGLPGLIGGCALATAMTGFIFSITLTSAAVTLFMLAAIPFIAAIIAYFALREKLRTMTLISMIIAFVGVLIMIYNDSLSGSILGALIGFFSATSVIKPASFNFTKLHFGCVEIKVTMPPSASLFRKNDKKCWGFQLIH